MQVIQTVNDTIRILFNPIKEGFKLLDFLLVQDENNKFLAQIIEIYDDKYDASQNVARVKLFFRVNDEGEVLDYNHYTPSKECEIKKIRQDEILTYINEDKEALTIGLDYKNEEPFDINLDFLKNSPVIFADKIEQSNCFSAHIAQTLSRYNKHSVIFDYSGTLEIKNAKKLVITKDIKMPLDFYSLEYIWEKGLATASLETQAICREIFNEVQTYAKSAPDGFIPFDKFTKVVNIQYKATPIVELTVLLNKLKAYQKKCIFAKNKKDFECINKSVCKNDITIVDFSRLKTEWHKEFAEFIIREIDTEAFVFLRLNDTNSDVDLINYIYDKKPNLSFVPSISYSYKKIPHIIERVNNYMLLPTLNPRRDFGAANFELASITNDECILFGKDTENFIFVIKNNKFEQQEENNQKARKTIRLKIEDINNTPVELDFDGSKFTPVNMQAQKPVETQITEEELEFFEQFDTEELQQEPEEEKIPVKKPEDGDVIEHHEEQIEPVQETVQETEEEIIEPEIENVVSYEEIPDEPAGQTEAEQNITQEPKDTFDDNSYDTPEAQPLFEEIEETEEEPVEAPQEQIEEPLQEQIHEEVQENTPESFIEEVPKEEDEPEQETGFRNILQEEQDEFEEPQEQADDSLSLETLAAQSIEATFNEVVENNTLTPVTQDTIEEDSNTLVIDKNVVIDLEKIKNQDENNNELPVFKHKKSQNKEKYQFSEGQNVEHEKYGRGEVVKVINYANRSLLQINFEEVGKRLLDPDIAKIKPL